MIDDRDQEGLRLATPCASGNDGILWFVPGRSTEALDGFTLMELEAWRMVDLGALKKGIVVIFLSKAPLVS